MGAREGGSQAEGTGRALEEDRQGEEEEEEEEGAALLTGDGDGACHGSPLGLGCLGRVRLTGP